MERPRSVVQVTLCACLVWLVSLRVTGWLETQSLWAADVEADVEAKAAGSYEALQEASLRSTSRRLNELYSAADRRLNTVHDNSSGNTSGSAGHGSAGHGSTTNGTGAHGSAHAGAHPVHTKSPAFDPVTFLLVTLFCSILSQQAVNMIPACMRPPHSVMLYSTGMILAILARASPDTEFGVAIGAIMTIDPHVIFWVFLPMLLYEDAANSDWHVVKRVLWSAIILALPGVILNTVLTGGLITMLGLVGFKPALLLGSILSATDPVAVVGALSALQAPAKLSSIISGESLLNDGSAVVLFQIFLEVASGRQAFNLWDAIVKLCRLAGGGVAFGLAVAVAAHIWLAKTRNFSVEMLLIICCVFGIFFTAEHQQFQFSGVLAVVTFGFFMSALGKYDLEPDREIEHEAIVKALSFICNEAIFIIAGIVGYEFSFLTPHIGARDWLDLLLLYLGVHVTRAITVGVCYPLLHRIGYRLSLGEATICVFGGLRGAVGLALALLVLHDPDISEEVQHKVCFFTNGIVLGTLFINGLLITPLYKFLKIQSPERATHHKKLMHCLLDHGDEMVDSRKNMMERHWFFRGCQFEKIKAMIPSLAEELNHADEDVFGRKRHILMTADRVRKSVDDIAKGMDGIDLEEAFKKKGEKSKGTSNINIFHTRSCANQAKHLEWKARHRKWAKVQTYASGLSKVGLEDNMASGVSKVNPEDSTASGVSTALGLQEPLSEDGFPLAEDAGGPMTPPLDPVVEVERQQSGKSSKSRESDEDDQPERNKNVKLGFFKHHRKHTVAHEDEEEAINGLFLELQQSLINSQRTSYKQMYETQALNRSAYEFLGSSIDFQMEAIDGDLKSYGFLKDDLPTIHTEKQAAQMRQGPKVAFCYLRTYMKKTESTLINLLVSLYGKRKSRILQWYLLERNVKVLLAYILVTNQNVEELEHIKHDLFGEDPIAVAVCDELLGSMTEMMVKARDECMYDLMIANPPMFKLLEHMLFAQLVVVQQIDILKELAEEGGIKEDDLEHFLKNMTEPSMRTVNRFYPSKKQLQDAGMKDVSNYSQSLDTLIYWVNKLSLEPVNS